MVNGKQKGNAFEREIANLLSERFKDYLCVPKGFMRNADSGARFGGLNRTSVKDYLDEMTEFGDIITPKDFRWSVECKSYKTPLSLNAILTQNCPDMDKWCQQASEDAKSADKFALLIVKYNGVKPFVMMKEAELKELSGLVTKSYATFRYKEWLAFTLEMFLSGKDECYFGVGFGETTELKDNKRMKHEHRHEPVHPIHTQQPSDGTAPTPEQLSESCGLAEQFLRRGPA